MYCTAACPYCQSAERLLAQKGVRELNRIRVDLEPARRTEMMQKSGRRTVPQIWIGERHVGGYDDLHDPRARGAPRPTSARGADLTPLPTPESA